MGPLCVREAQTVKSKGDHSRFGSVGRYTLVVAYDLYNHIRAMFLPNAINTFESYPWYCLTSESALPNVGYWWRIGTRLQVAES